MKPVIDCTVQKTRSRYDGYPEQKVVHVDTAGDLGNYICYKGFRESIPAEKAAEWGLIWKAVDDDALDAEVDAIANKLASLPPLGLAATKEMIRSSWQYSLDEELTRQAGAMRRLGFTEDYREGVAAFLEKRQPSFNGR